MCEWFLCEMRENWRIPVHTFVLFFLSPHPHCTYQSFTNNAVLLMLSFFIDVTDNSLSYDFLKKILLDLFFSFIFTPHLQIFWEDMIFCIYLGGGCLVFSVWVYGSKLYCSKKIQKFLYTYMKGFNYVLFINWIYIGKWIKYIQPIQNLTFHNFSCCIFLIKKKIYSIFWLIQNWEFIEYMLLKSLYAFRYFKGFFFYSFSDIFE